MFQTQAAEVKKPATNRLTQGTVEWNLKFN
jgi:hypothetical protein